MPTVCVCRSEREVSGKISRRALMLACTWRWRFLWVSARHGHRLPPPSCFFYGRITVEPVFSTFVLVWMRWLRHISFLHLFLISWVRYCKAGWKNMDNLQFKVLLPFLICGWQKIIVKFFFAVYVFLSTLNLN